MGLTALVGVALLVVGQTAGDLLDRAEAALKNGKAKEALALADEAVGKAPDSARARLVRGVAHEALREPKEAVADFDKALALDPKLAEAYDHRGSEHFKLGQFKESVADFDAYLKLRPEEKDGHWRRGISLYYAGKYEEGRDQFKACEKKYADDVENATWHYLCNARLVGVEKARGQMLKIVGKDRRVPMMEVYALYAGKAKPDDVLKAARAGDPKGDELKQRLFYAHLYLGLYYEADGDKEKAREYITKAADDYAIGHYMADVARVGRDVLGKPAKK
jgi:lipoprotein NlpI